MKIFHLQLEKRCALFILEEKLCNILYSFPVDVSPGYRMTSEPLVQRFHRIVSEKVSKITV